MIIWNKNIDSIQFNVIYIDNKVIFMFIYFLDLGPEYWLLSNNEELNGKKPSQTIDTDCVSQLRISINQNQDEITSSVYIYNWYYTYTLWFAYY